MKDYEAKRLKHEMCAGEVDKNRKFSKKKIKTYTINWGNGNLILDEMGLKDYLLNGGLFGDEDIREEPWEATIKVEFKYSEQELSELPEFDF